MALSANEDPLCRQRVGQATQETMDSIRYSNSHSREEQTRHVKEIAWSSVHKQTTVGVGGFCRVHQVQIQHPDFDCNTQLALKCLRADVMELDEKIVVSAATDLVIEGELLSRLEHPNIIKLHGVCGGGPLKSFTETQQGYFILIDLLDDTLKNRLEKCRSQSRGGGGGFLSFKSKFTKSTAVFDRIENIAMGIARGLSHLHFNNIVLRDLKPDNIGFDRNGTAKIFDFGLAREVNTIQANEVAGTMRYMAPEVVLGGGYQKASDVYSFGVLLWELCTLEKPFHQFKTTTGFKEGVVKGNFRPSLAAIHHPALRKVIQDCWDANPKARPTMSQVVRLLRRFNSDPTRRQYSSVACVGEQPPHGGRTTSSACNSSTSSTATRKADTRLTRTVSLKKCLLSQSFSGTLEQHEPRVGVDDSLQQHRASDLSSKEIVWIPPPISCSQNHDDGTVSSTTVGQSETEAADTSATMEEPLTTILTKPFQQQNGEKKRRLLHYRITKSL